MIDIIGYRRNWKPAVKKKKVPPNEFKVRHQYQNVLNRSTFKIVKKFWLDIEWAYKIRYESGTEHVYTECHFRALVTTNKIKKIPKDYKEKEHFGDDTLFVL